MGFRFSASGFRQINRPEAESRKPEAVI